MLSIVSFARRWAPIALLGALAAGCSASGISGTNFPASGPDAGRSVAQNRMLAQGRGPHSQNTRSQSRGWISPDRRHKSRKGLIYWGSYDNSTITIFASKGVNGKEKGQITTGLSNPERLFVDKQGSVYATNIGNNTITAYKRGQTSPFITISSGVNAPTGITVDAAGTIYCANVGNNTITVYPKGQTSPSLTIPYFAEYLATDAHDNLYAAGSAVEEFAPGSTSGKDLGLPSLSWRFRGRSLGKPHRALRQLGRVLPGRSNHPIEADQRRWIAVRTVAERQRKAALRQHRGQHPVRH